MATWDTWISLLDHVAKSRSRVRAQLSDELTALKKKSWYQDILSDLETRLSALSLGLAAAAPVTHRRMREALADEARAHSVFGQSLAVAAPGCPAVARSSFYGLLDAWYRSWPTSRSVAIVYGEEGTGKTWATYAWVLNRIIGNTSALVLDITERTRAAVSEPGALLGTMLATVSAVQSPDFWKRRVNRWIRRPPSNTPLIVLILDDLRLSELSSWLPILNALSVSPWNMHVAVIATCRTEVWNARLAPLTHIRLLDRPITDYDDNEFTVATTRAGLDLSCVQPTLVSTLRNPRYLDCAARMIVAGTPPENLTLMALTLGSLADVSVRRPGTAIDMSSFVGFFAQAVKHPSLLSGAGLRLLDIEVLLGGATDVQARLDELTSRRILITRGGLRITFDLAPAYRSLGLGYNLAETVAHSPTLLDEAFDCAFANAGLSEKAQILGAAAHFGRKMNARAQTVLKFVAQRWAELIAGAGSDPDVLGHSLDFPMEYSAILPEAEQERIAGARLAESLTGSSS